MLRRPDDAGTTVEPRPQEGSPEGLIRALSSGSSLRVQVFGRRDSRETQKALRFFKERRIEISFVDVAAKPPSPAELRRFAERLGARALIDESSRVYRELGIGYLRMDDGEVLQRVLADPRLLRLPLVRVEGRVAVGPDDVAWRALVKDAAG